MSMFFSSNKDPKPKKDNQQVQMVEEPISIPQSPHFMTVQSDYIFPYPSKVFKKIVINDPLKKQIDSLCISIPNHKQDSILDKIGKKKNSIQFLILQLASLKTYSEIQDFNDEFDQKERSNYEAFLQILNNANYDEPNISETVINEIKKEYEKPS